MLNGAFLSNIAIRTKNFAITDPSI